MNTIYRSELPFTAFFRPHQSKSGFALVNSRNTVEAISYSLLEKVGYGDVTELPLGIKFDVNLLIKDFDKLVCDLN